MYRNMLKNIVGVVVICLLVMSPRGGVSAIAQEPLQHASPVIDMLDLKEVDILDVLKLISQKSGVNIVTSQQVGGKVTVYLKDTALTDALRIICDAHGWAYMDEGSVIKMMTAQEFSSRYGYSFGRQLETSVIKVRYGEPASLAQVLTQIKSAAGVIMHDAKSSTLIVKDQPAIITEMRSILAQLDVPVETATFRLNYAKAAEIVGHVEGALTPTIGTAKSDERSNTIVVADTAQKIDEIRSIIAAFDKKDTEVLIEAKIVQVVLNDEHKMGVDWEAVASSYHGLTVKGDLGILGATDKSGRVSIGTLASDNYTALVEALNTIGTSNLLSSPRIATVNNAEAKIVVGSTEPYVTTTTTTTASGPATTAESINFIEVGVKLYVTPTVHDDGYVTMKIRPEVSSVVTTITTSTNNTVPVVETSEAETTVIVKDGATIVIGGLIKEERVSSKSRIPLLGSIPVVGAAFRNSRDSLRKTEIVIFLTPTIIDGAAQ